jgi:hypothetical protein
MLFVLISIHEYKAAIRILVKYVLVLLCNENGVTNCSEINAVVV